MKKCISAILLVLSVGALAAGRLSAAVADDKVDTIRLPSQGLADEVATAAAREKKRPWRCCDKRICFWFRGKPSCYCVDQVDQCDDACTDCQPVSGDPSKHTCRTSYTGDPGPKSTKLVDGTGDDMSAGAAAAATETVVGEKSVGVRPKCCDLLICITTMVPNVCTCKDMVHECAKTCERCKKQGALYVCKDVFPVSPTETRPPRCTNTDVVRRAYN